MYEKFGQFIDGKWQQSSDKKTYEVINPANEEVLGHASKAAPADVDKALKSAEKGLKLLFESWARMEDEAPDSLRDQLQDLRYKWGALARDFFKS